MNKHACELFLEKLMDAEELGQAKVLLKDPHASHCSECFEQATQTVRLWEAMGKAPVVAPPSSVRQHFYHTLHQEMRGGKPVAVVRKFSFRWMAAASVLLIAGTIACYLLINKKQPELSATPTTTEPVNDAVVSVSQRVNGISTAADEQPGDPKLVKTLLNILERDKNPHVRMAAFYGLAKYKAVPEVHSRLVAVLESEQDPMMQVLLINLLTETREPRALDAVRAVITNQKTRKEVKTLALSKI
jgi:hypothetical protein